MGGPVTRYRLINQTKSLPGEMGSDGLGLFKIHSRIQVAPQKSVRLVSGTISRGRASVVEKCGHCSQPDPVNLPGLQPGSSSPKIVQISPDLAQNHCEI